MLEKSVKQNGRGIERIFNAAYCSINGFIYTWRNETAFKQEGLLVLMLFPLSFFVAQDLGTWCAMVLSLGLVVITELINTAIEVVADRITLSYDIQIKNAKDVASAAVFFSLVLVAIIWTYAVATMLS